ncbi:threonine--tRNA ligase, partial [Candidatus Parcubacteria bacterium]
PGAPFWHGNGMILFKELEAFIRSELDKAGYQEIATPIVVKKEVFETSGHWSHFREDMFFWEQDGETYVLKPMNCPESTFVYRAHTRSYKDLPLRFAEIGRIHRNELSGTLAGLFRVRQITQDDAHIYCRPDQIQSEILALLKLVKKIYRLFGFRPSFYLATKPDKALGEPKLWKKAERALKLALDESKLSYDIKPKDGAFYGPKIDVHIKDALGRDWQLATIQLDLVMLPERFQLSYVDEKGKLQKPVVIHRAIFGSFERFIGILIEHFAGSFPLWLAPVQAEVINVGAGQRNYAAQVTKLLTQASIRARLSGEHLTVGKRIREAELQKVPYILVVGEKEKKNRTANVRHHRKGQLGEQSISSLIAHLQEEIAKKAR